MATTDQSPAPLGEGSTLDDYVLVEEIGAGAFAHVFKAHEAKLDRTVAVKVLSNQTGELSTREFERECASVGRISRHQNIVTVLSAGESDGHLYIAMDLYDGSLSSLIKKRQLTVQRAVRIGRLVASALSYAHENRVIHRDIKPQNILFSEDHNDLLLADFCIACRIKEDGQVTEAHGLTPTYAAPETIEGSEPTVRSDLYSLGATLYAALNRAPAFAARGLTQVELQERVLTQALPPLQRQDVPEALWKLLVSLMAKDPADRPVSAAEVEKRLQLIEDEINPDNANPDDLELTTGYTTLSQANVGIVGRHHDESPTSTKTIVRAHDNTGRATTKPDKEEEETPPERQSASDLLAQNKRTIFGVGAVLLLLIGVIGVSALTGGSNSDQVTTSTIELDTPESTTVADLTPLDAPQGITFETEGTDLAIEWEPVDGATEYRVRFLSSTLDTKRTTSPLLTMEPPSELTGDLCLQVVAIDDTGRQGRESDPKCTSLDQ